jgi:hypothetical protein
MSLLVGKAHAAYVAYAQPIVATGRRITWAEFVMCLQTFAKPDRQLAARLQLRKLKQTGSVQEYLQAFNILVARSGAPAPVDTDLLLSFWEGLKPQAKGDSKVDPTTGKWWGTFHDLSQHALAVESTRRLSREDTDMPEPRSSAPFKTFIPKRKTFGHSKLNAVRITDAQNRGQERNQRKGGDGRGGGRGPPTGGRGRGRDQSRDNQRGRERSSDEAGPSDWEKMQCYNCKGYGHKADQCPSKKARK